jgi:diguanylate cyclase (GGDEF)-like protein/PAS domain S-box-containing protein/putative nucleotidyltransferase with HDIG domain
VFRVYFASFRLAIGLVSVGAGLIFGCQWLGLIPDVKSIQSDARAKRCQAIALTTAGMIRTNDWPTLQTTLSTLVRRDDGLVAIGLRTDRGTLKIDTGRHREIWQSAVESDEFQAIHVPIALNKKIWGQIEFCFVPLHGTGPFSWAELPVIRILVFFICAGLFSYTLFIARVLGLFDSVQVVPDRVRQALDTLAEGLLVLDEQENIILANKSFTQTVGLTAEELAGRNASSLSWVKDDPASADDFPWRRARDANEPQSEQLMRYRISDYQQRIFSINSAPIQCSGGGSRGALVTLRDVTQLEENRCELEAMLAMIKESRDEISKKNRELEVLATQDSLTGCFNRRAFFERFDIAFRFSKAHGVALACVMVDNDHFKSVNDTYGHHIGDEVLRKVGALLRRLHSDAHAVCRFGGEEFCIMLPGFDLEDAAKAAERIRSGIAAIRLDEPAELRLSASVGVSDMTFGAADPQTLINQADACLYVAKRAGRNRVVLYDPSMANAAAEPPAARQDVHRDGVKRIANVPISASCPAVRSLVSALAFRDADTAEHSRRVADHCIRTAQGLQDEIDLSILEVAALLHDIGKIGVPDHILLKPAGLTEEEWKLMSRHDQIGVEIVENLFDSPELLAIIRCHHCYYDGHGRSDSCPVGSEIPVAARILSIADSYDAMVSDRVYRDGCSHEEAIAELRRCSGSQFDPELVERFIETIDDSVPVSAFGNVCSAQVQAFHFSKQVDRLATAIESQNPTFVKNLAARVRSIAVERNLSEIVDVAGRLELQVDAEVRSWTEVLRDSHELIRLCHEAEQDLVGSH